MLIQQIKKTLTGTRPGATSFYIVIYASMLFTIIVIGFVAIIMSGSFQTENDKLSRSAYNSALAGVEDAKLAIINCLASDVDCGFISENATASDCNSVAIALGRTIDETSGAVINESIDSEASEEMLQGYTCAMVSNNLVDYRSYISATDADSIRLVPLRAAVDTDAITGVKISWYASGDSQDNVYDFRNIKNGEAYFGPVSSGFSMPPAIVVQLIQTDAIFSVEFDEVDYTVGDTTDRGLLFLIPSDNTGTQHIANSASTNTMVGAIPVSSSTSNGFLKANDKAKVNTPYIVKCDPSGSSEFICNVTIELPLPVQSSYDTHNEGLRNNTTAFLVISLPYGQPATDFAVELCTDKGDYTDNDNIAGNCGSTTNFVNAQYSIDSTGRANDVYRRIETRVEIADTYFPYPQYTLQLTGSGEVLSKKFWSTLGGGYPNGCWASLDGDITECSAGATSGTLTNPYDM